MKSRGAFSFPLYGELLRSGVFVFGSMLGLLPATLSGAQSARVPDKPVAPIVAGWIERISFPDHKLYFEAKLDTGATSSAIHAENLIIVQKDGRPFVKFELIDDTGKSIVIETPVTRRVRIKRAGVRDDSRVVVRLKVCLGGIVQDADFTLVGREELAYQVIIGRSALAGRILVDSGRDRIVSDLCTVPK